MLNKLPLIISTTKVKCFCSFKDRLAVKWHTAGCLISVGRMETFFASIRGDILENLKCVRVLWQNQRAFWTYLLAVCSLSLLWEHVTIQETQGLSHFHTENSHSIYRTDGKAIESLEVRVAIVLHWLYTCCMSIGHIFLILTGNYSFVCLGSQTDWLLLGPEHLQSLPISNCNLNESSWLLRE